MDNNWHNFRSIICKKHKITDNEIEQLQELDLSKTKLTILPAEIENLAQLQKLDLSNNELTTLPPQIGNLSRLQTLSLIKNQLTVLPVEIGNLTQLQELNLYRNKLTALPKEITNLSQLQELNLYRNKLTALPIEIGNLSQLRRLYLHENQLTVLPIEISKCMQLQILSLSFNKLTSLPKEIANLVQLQTIFLNNNKLTALPTEIANLVRLQSIFVNNNNLTNIPICIIHLPNLENLLYHNNEITNLHPAITRWLNRSKTTQNVYSNSQSVHDHNIESTTNASIIKFVSSHQTKDSDVFDLVDKLNTSVKTKNLLKAYCNCDYVHSNLKLTFDEVALPVLDYINNDHHNKQDLLKILDDEMAQSEGKCFQGRLTRLINVLNGYHPDVNINISSNEQIGNIIIMLKKQFPDIDPTKFIDIFTKEMNDRKYDQITIDEWITHIQDNL